jgi:hypothetical protein
MNTGMKALGNAYFIRAIEVASERTISRFEIMTSLSLFSSLFYFAELYVGSIICYEVSCERLLQHCNTII